MNSRLDWIGGWYNVYISGFIYLFFRFFTAKSDPGKKINIGCNMIISRMERLELLEFPRYDIFLPRGKPKNQKPVHITSDIPYPYPTFQNQSVSVPYPHQKSWNSSVPAPVPVPSLKKIPYPSCLRMKNPDFFLTRSFYAPVLGYGCVDVDGFRLRTPDPARD